MREFYGARDREKIGAQVKLPRPSFAIYEKGTLVCGDATCIKAAVCYAVVNNGTRTHTHIQTPSF